MSSERPANPQRVAVIGAGAIGGFYAAAAEAAGHDVTLCVRRPIDELVVEIGGTPRKADVRIVSKPGGLTPHRWVFLATKAQDTDAAAPWLARLAAAGSTVVVLQNGVDQIERIAPLAPGAEIVPTVVHTSAEKVAPGRIVLHTGQTLVLAAGRTHELIAELFAGTGVRIEANAEFTTEAWRKLMGNVSVNPITALTQRRIGVMHEPDVRDLARGLLTEAVAVARAEGAKLAPDEVEKTLAVYSAFNPNGGSSMYYDRLAGRPMEHEYLTGVLVRRAERHGLPVPLNRAMLALLRAVANAPQAA